MRTSAPSADAGTAPRRRGRPPEPGLREVRQQAIVRAAYHVLAERGYERSSISDIARAAGVGQGTVYRYFESKRELLDHVFDYAVSRVAGALQIDALADLDLTDYRQSVRLPVLFGSRLFALVDEDPAIVRLITVESSAVDLELRYRVLGFFAAVDAMLGQLFQRANPDRRSESDRRTWGLLGRLIAGMAGPGVVMAVRNDTPEDRRSAFLASMAAISERGLLTPAEGTEDGAGD